MFKKILVILTLLSTIVGKTQTISDADGNIYNTVVIGSQIWMSSNLQTTHYANGDEIPTTVNCYDNVTGEFEPKYQWAYNCSESLVPTYGRLYTWYVVSDSRNVCPVGWHVPSITEFDTLKLYLGGATVAGGKLKETGFLHWNAPNTGATNEYGYNGVPNGHRSIDGSFTGLGTVSDTWSTTEGTLGARDFDLNHDNAAVVSYDDNKEFGFAIRCLSNLSSNEIGQQGSSDQLLVYPTLTTYDLNIVVKMSTNVPYQLRSANGQLIFDGYLNPGLNKVSVENIDAGFYILILSDQNNYLTYKIFKQ